MDPEVQHLYDQVYKNSMFLIENYVNSGPPKKDNSLSALKKKKSSFKGILKASKSQYKRSKIFEINEGEIKFKDMIPIHMMWKEYMRDLVGNVSQLTEKDQKPKSNESIITLRTGLLLKVLKADLHGAIISVFESKSCQVGLEGIIVKESRQTFTIITPDDRLKTLSKANMTFLLKLPDGPKIKVF